VLKLVEQLPDRQREAVRSRFLEEREYGEIAQKLGCSELVARQSVSRGLARLRDQLTEGQGSGTTAPGGAQDPSAGYYVLRGAPALSGKDITDPHQGKDPNARTPDVTVGFTASGAKAFHALTATIARRGSLVSGLGEALNQHFAVVLDNRLITVPYVDFKQYPGRRQPRQGHRDQRQLHRPEREGPHDPPALRPAPDRAHGSGVNGYITTAAASTHPIQASTSLRCGPIRRTRSAVAR
jgi:preprotein translocase subunit SecD